MQPPDLAEVERARNDGRWDRACPTARALSTPAVPEDLMAALIRAPKACAFFESLDRTNRCAILERLQTAKTDRTHREICHDVYRRERRSNHDGAAALVEAARDGGAASSITQAGDDSPSSLHPEA
jgi:hypothetical protein